MQNLINKLTIYGESKQVKDLQNGIQYALEKLWEAGDAMFDNALLLRHSMALNYGKEHTA